MPTVTIDFDPTSPPFDSLALYGFQYPNPFHYFEQGLEFSTDGHGFVRSNSAQDGPALFNNSGIGTVYLRSVTSSPFDILSVGLDGYNNGAGTSVTFNFVATTVGGQSLATSFTTDAAVGLETFTFPSNFIDLTELRWTVTGGTQWGIFDNVVVDAVETNSFEGTVQPDVIAGTNGNDEFILNNGEAFFRGGADIVHGRGGDDLFYFGSAFQLDAVDGGAGQDQVLLQGDYSQVHALSMVGVETVILLSGSDTTYGDLGGNFYSYNLNARDVVVGVGQQLRIDGSALTTGENLTFNGTAETDGRFELIGGGGNDNLNGGAGNDSVLGGAGNDALNGGAGNDILIGGAGNDAMAGGTGNDAYRVEQLGDTIIELVGEGDDTVFSAINLTLAAGAEIETMGTTSPRREVADRGRS